jgi:uncharacterized protein
MEIRTLPTPPKADGRRVTGYAARFNSPSEVLSERGKVFRETLLPGAFARSLKTPPRGDVLALWQHGRDGRPPLGRTSAETLRLWEDAEGLAFELVLPESAADVREAVSRRDVRGMSFGFGPTRDRWTVRDGMQHHEISELDLYEVSLVITPAYPSTSVEARDRSAIVVPEPQPSAIARAKHLLAIAERDAG